MSERILEFPKIHRMDNANDALEAAKGWGFRECMIVGYVDNGGTPDGTIILASSTHKIDTAKNKLFMAELLRHMALKDTGLV